MDNLNLIKKYKQSYNLFARDLLGVRLDHDQQEILESIQINRRTTVRSGHARGKDFVGAVAALCFLYLEYPSKVICTAPTGRQVKSIMIAEVAHLHKRSNAKLTKHGFQLGGTVQATRIKFEDDTNHFLEGFKASDKATESWTGFHSPNLLVIITEASGILQDTYNAVEGILTGNSRLLLIGNPNNTIGEFFNSFKSELYNSFTLSCLTAPNVKAKKILIPGQVDYDWVDEHVRKTGWASEIKTSDVNQNAFHDFKWSNKWYRPSNLFKIKVLGEFPTQSEHNLIPYYWIELANQRWLEINDEKVVQCGREINITTDEDLYLSIDVAGMGRDMTIFSHQIGNFVWKFNSFARVTTAQIVGYVKIHVGKQANMGRHSIIFVDTIGEGAGVYSMLVEALETREPCMRMVKQVVSVKFSRTARGLHDLSGEHGFVNLRSYCLWALRDSLNPEMVEFGGGNLAIPPCEELTQELTEIQWDFRSNGLIYIEEKDKIKKRIGRSPDYSDATSGGFCPYKKLEIEQNTMRGVGVF